MIRCVREVGGLGDLLRMFSSLAGLKKKFPDSELHFYGPPEYRDVFMDGHCPSVDGYFSIDKEGRVRKRDQRIDESRYKYLAQGIKYDLEFDLFCPAFMHERRTRGAVRRERTDLWCESVSVPFSVPKFHLSEDEIDWGMSWVVETEADPEKIIFIQPYGTIGPRNWPIEHWQELTKMLTGAGFYVVSLDGPGGTEMKEASQNEIGRPFGELASIINECKFAITPDSGLFHFAGVRDVPCLGIFGCTNGNVLCRPYKKATYIIADKDAERPRGCKEPCYAFMDRGYHSYCQASCKAMEQVTPKMVFDRFLELFKEETKMAYLVESRKIDNRADVRAATQGNGVDLGAGHGKIRETSLGIDFGSCGKNWEGDVTTLHWFKDEVLDYVYSSHTLEHVDDDRVVLKEWLRVIKPGGRLVLYLPDDEEFDNTEQVANREHKHVYTVESLRTLLESIGGLEIITCVQDKGKVEAYPGHNRYSVLAIARKI